MNWTAIKQWAKDNPSVTLVLMGMLAGCLITLVFTFG